MNADKPFVCKITTRWSDFDAMGHVNNAIYLSYLGDAREQFFLAAGIGRQDWVVAAVELEFVLPVSLGTEEVVATVACARIGRSSIKTIERLSVDGTIVVNASTVSVLVDQSGRPEEVHPDARLYLEDHRVVTKTEEVST